MISSASSAQAERLFILIVLIGTCIALAGSRGLARAQASSSAPTQVGNAGDGQDDHEGTAGKSGGDDSNAQGADDASSEEGDSDETNQAAQVDGDDKDDPVAALEPTLQKQLNRYHDSEGYTTLTTTTALNISQHDCTFSLLRNTVSASDKWGRESAESAVMSLHKYFSEQFGLGGGIGSFRTTRFTDLVGSLQGHADLRDLGLEAGVSRTMLAATALEIRENIRQTDFLLGSSYDFGRGLTAGIEFHNRWYTDGNRSRELEFSPQYSWSLPVGKATVGYSFDYQSFAQSPDHGYWAPQLLISQGATAAWNFDLNDLYGKIELGAGRSKVNGSSRNGPTGGYDGSFAAVLGFRPERNWTVEYYWGGEGSEGWSSTAAGLSMTYTY